MPECCHPLPEWKKRWRNQSGTGKRCQNADAAGIDAYSVTFFYTSIGRYMLLYCNWCKYVKFHLLYVTTLKFSVRAVFSGALWRKPEKIIQKRRPFELFFSIGQQLWLRTYLLGKHFKHSFQNVIKTVHKYLQRGTLLRNLIVLLSAIMFIRIAERSS